ncbi:MAG: hypothetical protein L0099_16770, partial [Acidobacteria bacterium]|nr:hypothetical protein [Acidobacteriota bacterium]
MRLSLKVAARLGRRAVFPAVWVATVGLLSWAVAEGLSAAQWLTPAGLMVAWSFVLFCLHRGARGARLGAWPALSAPDRPLLAVAFAGLATLLVGTLVIALAAPPNNWDAMAYHNPRVMQWLDRGSVEHYYTVVNRQLRMPPLVSYMRLHLMALTAGDLLFNAVQWTFYLASVVLSGAILWVVSSSLRAALLASVLTATVPMAVIQASSAQNDVVTAACLLAALLAAVTS